jgi:hypothetical protein
VLVCTAPPTSSRTAKIGLRHRESYYLSLSLSSSSFILFSNFLGIHRLSLTLYPYSPSAHHAPPPSGLPRPDSVPAAAITPSPRVWCRKYVSSCTSHYPFKVLIYTDIASISAVEGKNWRHGDIEDILKTVAFIHGHKWTSTMIKRVYFGNWLRD